jgi:hypothetical protein
MLANERSVSVVSAVPIGKREVAREEGWKANRLPVNAGVPISVWWRERYDERSASTKTRGSALLTDGRSVKKRNASTDGKLGVVTAELVKTYLDVTIACRDVILLVQIKQHMR